MSDLPDWAKSGRAHWKYYGQKRPPFAREPGEGEESVWDYPRPPKIDRDSRKVEVYVGDVCIAETTKAIRILETASPPTFYLPPEDVNMEYLKSVAGHSRCEWKGTAQYWDVKTEDEHIQQAGWSYPDAFEDYQDIAGYLCFYPGKLDCYVDGEKVRPQPGGFYGGWITSEIVGPVKGESPQTYL